jgi:hypothetical protein
MGKRVLGKVKSGIETGARIFNKGKEIYSNAKNFVTNLPVVGNLARDVIQKAETSANEMAKRNLGVNFNDVNQAVSRLETGARYLPT